MIVAVTVWGNRISPVFDSAQNVLLAEIRNGQIIHRTYKSIGLLVPVEMAQKIIAFNSDSLICGAISQEPAQVLEEAGITLMSFISGRAEHVLNAYMQNEPINDYCMPGCARAWRARHRHHVKR